MAEPAGILFGLAFIKCEPGKGPALIKSCVDELHHCHPLGCGTGFGRQAQEVFHHLSDHGLLHMGQWIEMPYFFFTILCNDHRPLFKYAEADLTLCSDDFAMIPFFRKAKTPGTIEYNTAFKNDVATNGIIRCI